MLIWYQTENSSLCWITFDSTKDLIYNLGKYVFEHNHLKSYGEIEYLTSNENQKVSELLSYLCIM